HYIPAFMEGGPGNPLGARALYIGGTLFRIHGTNDAGSIGGAVSSGCIRMMNSDVVDLYNLVRVGARVYVYQ
ncbi:MAG: L,D-transpeptidase, partial [Rhizobiales bacterium]|nr:L,D-transpeptidase [Hyphomicrobiales bacterium]